MSIFYYNKPQESYDAIVVGTGISGGWAAKELCEKGLKTLVLERGRMVKHIEDYPTANLDPWDLPNAGRPTKEVRERKFKQMRTGYTTNMATEHFFVDDIKHPYNEDRRFDWMRGYHVGGRSLMWGRQSYRMGDVDFEANAKDGIAVDWPVRYAELKPWYDYVENFIGVSGTNLGLPQLPDGNFLPPMELNCVEKHVQSTLEEKFKDRVLTIGRTAHITEGTKPGAGRSNCQYRNRCARGCPFGAYFSSNSSTLPVAEATGNMTLRPNSIVHEVLYDEETKRATGVRVIDAETKETFEFKAKVIFLCASAIASTSILMQSKSDRFPNGMGNDSGELGHNLMDHHFRVGASGTYDGFEDMYYRGRRANGIYIPRFRNMGGDTDSKDFIRGYGYQGGGSRGSNWTENVKELAFGKEFKDEILKPGPWSMGLTGFGETLPDHNNRMYLDYEKKDAWGLPTVTFDADFGANELAMREDMKNQAAEMLEAAGFRDVHTYDDIGGMGLGIHEMGTARMGRDPKTSVLNKHNQLHAVPNVYVTDGSFMTSSACQNPSLSYMAFTARAANHAVEELKKMNL
ncbi:GMC family oxidoreductase [Robertkochia marina]|uniref:GMC family oxidoreductase n=1 Tax=Robertkochia marina TaxID=1227945 RepID=A0A4S3M310_9FLAO|nr:GMC family oxidoreductase [Robertkochia marina]THD69095.1 GMC family oxidoreductase [Robertkochia marina]TRZ44919.1 GMC family oxidoreductase [Robertkochia marina]